MFRRIVVILSTFSFSIAVLAFTLLRVTSIKYNFSSRTLPVLAAESETKIEVDYTLPYPGKILPDSPLWFIKAARDKALILFAKDSLGRAKVELLLADKRIQGSMILFQKGKSNLALSTFTKGEKYLEEAMSDEEKARNGGKDTSAFLIEFSKAALKHRQISDEILMFAPEDVKPKIIEAENYSRNVYKETRDILLSRSILVPKSPFSGD